MKQSEETHRRRIVTMAGAALVTLAAAPTFAATPCTTEAVAALTIPAVTITSATPAVTNGVANCTVLGTVATDGEGAGPNTARFQVRLPSTWSQRYVFQGVGGLAGGLSPAVNGVDGALFLPKGYVTAVTDTGHVGGNGLFGLTPDGDPDQAKIADFAYRAAHQVGIATKKLAEAYYADKIKYSYFEGCSNGGRMALIQAGRYPDDYDGIIAGAPAGDSESIFHRTKVAKAQLRGPEAYIPSSLLAAIDAKVRANCDGADGVTDGLIQNPAACTFKASDLLCSAGNTADCLTSAQVETLNSYFTPVVDKKGDAIYPGFPVSDLSGTGGYAAWTSGNNTPNFSDRANPFPISQPSSYFFADQYVRYLIKRDPAYVTLDLQVDPVTGVLSKDEEKLLAKRLDGFSNQDHPQDLLPFMNKGKKMIIYHGWSDPALSGFRTTELYKDLAHRRGGYEKLRQDVRLFMVPGMQHCSGGPGPNAFDTITAMENWVENGIAPDSILARRTAAPLRSMPLCPFPQQAHYLGTGDVNDAVNWACTDNEDLLEIGPAGKRAGVTAERKGRDHDRADADERG